MSRISIDEKAWAKLSKKQFMADYGHLDKFFEGGAEAYYDKIKEEHKKIASKESKKSD